METVFTIFASFYRSEIISKLKAKNQNGSLVELQRECAGNTGACREWNASSSELLMKLSSLTSRALTSRSSSPGRGSSNMQIGTYAFAIFAK